jgi:hypothetical protein
MKKSGSYSRQLSWATAILFSTFIAGCGSGGDGGGHFPNSATKAGAGTGVNNAGRGPAPVNLGSVLTNNFVVLSKAGITNTGSHATSITGNIGASPITAASMNGVFCSELTGLLYGIDAAYVGSGDASCAHGTAPDKTLVDNAVLDMGTAYADANSRAPDYTELGAGSIGGLNLGPATYNWSSAVSIPTNLTLTGGANDVWIFQIAQGLSVSSGVQIILAGGALPQNIYWATFAAADMDTTSKFKGTILSKTDIAMKTGATINGRLLAQSAVTLDKTVVTP